MNKKWLLFIISVLLLLIYAWIIKTYDPNFFGLLFGTFIYTSIIQVLFGTFIYTSIIQVLFTRWVEHD